MVTFFFGVGLVLALALLIAIYLKLDRIAPRLWALHKRERAADESRALTALTEATAAKVGTITAGLRTYEEHLASAYRDLVAAAETRARMTERRASEVGVALTTACELVRELRAMLDDQPAPDPGRITPMLDDEPDDEQTTVAPRSLAVPAPTFPARQEGSR